MIKYLDSLQHLIITSKPIESDAFAIWTHLFGNRPEVFQKMPGDEEDGSTAIGFLAEQQVQVDYRPNRIDVHVTAMPRPDVEFEKLFADTRTAYELLQHWTVPLMEVADRNGSVNRVGLTINLVMPTLNSIETVGVLRNELPTMADYIADENLDFSFLVNPRMKSAKTRFEVNRIFRWEAFNQTFSRYVMPKGTNAPVQEHKTIHAVNIRADLNTVPVDDFISGEELHAITSEFFQHSFKFIGSGINMVRERE